MKKTIIIIGIFALSMALGFGIGMAIDSIVGGGADSEPIDRMRLLWGLVWAFVALIVSFVVSTLLHEAGHLVGGLLTGYTYLSFRIGNITLQKEDDGWHWKKFNIAGTLGQCLMCPPEREDVPYFWYNAGGVLVNLFIFTVSGVMLYCLDLTAVSFAFCAMMFGVGVYLFIMNALPMKPGGVPNDGMNIWTLWRHPDQRIHFRNMMAVMARQARGERLHEMPGEWFSSVPVTKQSTVMELSARNLHYSRLMDELRFEEAHAMAGEMLAMGKDLPGLFRMEVAGDYLLMELATNNRKEVVEELWNTKNAGLSLEKYLRMHSKYSALKCATLFAYELLYSQNPDKAQPYYDEVKARKDSYTQIGEGLTALAIMERLKGKAENR